MSAQSMKTINKTITLEHPLPNRSPEWRYQNGISDPYWPASQTNTLSAEEREIYTHSYVGRVDPQKFFSLLRADVKAKNKEDLIHLLRLLSERVEWYLQTTPSDHHVMPMSSKEIPSTYRVTVTVGFGASLFLDKTGFDRFGISSGKPRFLKVMPEFPGGAPEFIASEKQSDLVVMVCSDHPYVNTAIVRNLAEKFNTDFRSIYHRNYPVLQMLGVEQGFGRPDKREFLRFDDGIDNIRVGQDLEQLVYVSEKDPEPRWCINGSYMVYRKIRENLPTWESMDDNGQEKMIGREKQTGKPLSPSPNYPKDEAPSFHGKGAGNTPFNAHIRKVQPRREGLDLFGMPDLERRFLRRPYPYFEGINKDGQFVNGLHFVAFMKSIQHQFEHVTNMWQMNRDFPSPGTGFDALYEHKILSTVDGGYYFCPPKPASETDFFGSGLF